MKIAVGSTNPVKIQAVEETITKIFDNSEIIPINTKSVIEMPINEKDIITGAENRALSALKLANAELGIGLESGMVEKCGKYYVGMAAAAPDQKGDVAKSGVFCMELPQKVAMRVLQGEELGKVVGEMTNIKDIKNNTGAIWVLTNGLVDKQEASETLLKLALAKKIRPELYW